MTETFWAKIGDTFFYWLNTCPYYSIYTNQSQEVSGLLFKSVGLLPLSS